MKIDNKMLANDGKSFFLNKIKHTKKANEIIKVQVSPNNDFITQSTYSTSCNAFD